MWPGLLGWLVFGILPLLHESLPHLFEPGLRPPYVVLLGLPGVLFKAIEYEYYVVLPSEINHAIPSAFVAVLQLENAIPDGLHSPHTQSRRPSLPHFSHRIPKTQP